MATATRRRAAQSQRFTAGPFTGVRTTVEPFDDAPNQVYDAENVYMADTTVPGGFYARPGFELYTAAALDTGTFRGQGVFTHIDLSGTAVQNFIVMKGKLYRADSTFSTFTDVSPAGITIDASVTTRVYGIQFGDSVVVTDGVNRPWIMSNFTSSPVTGTYIDRDSAGTAWTAYGRPTVYGGSLFFILSTVNSVGMRSSITWSNPADASTGYDQTNYDFTWTIFATGVASITAIQGTNTALFYGTANTIGEIVGPVGPNLQSTATTAAIAVNVGMAIPQTVVLFGQTIYFCDQLGRPYMLPIGGQPQPIWQQMREVIDTSTAGFPNVTLNTATATFEPAFNMYLVAIYSCLPSSNGPATEAYAFDARTGVYMGRWSIGTGVQLDTLGIAYDINGRGTLIALGSVTAPTTSALAASGFVWGMNGLASTGDFLTTEDGVFLCTEVNPPTPPGTTEGTFLTTEGSPANWQDNAEVPTITVVTNKIGYDATVLLNVDRASAIVGSAAPLTVTMETAAVTTTTEGTPTAVTTYDGVYRATVGADIGGRGVTVTLSPTTAASQWSVQQITVDAVPSLAGPEDS